MAKRVDNTPGELNLEQLVGSAVQQGLGVMLKNNPNFRKYKLPDYLDNERLSEYAREFEKNLKRTPENKREKYAHDFYKTIAGYAASGRLFNEKGQELVLRKSWGKKAKSWIPTKGRGQARELLKGEEYLERTIASFKELYDIMATKGYAERMPEIANAVATVYQAGFWDAALNTLYENKKLDKGRYLTLKQALRKKVDKGVSIMDRGIEQYLGQAAVVFAGIGLVVLIVTISANTITGNVTGITDSISLPALIFGGVSLISGLFLWIKRKKRNER